MAPRWTRAGLRRCGRDADSRSAHFAFRDSFVFTTEPITSQALPEPVHLFTTSLDDGTTKQLTSGVQSLGDGSPISWSPDGKTIAVTLCRNAIINDQSYSHAALVDAASGRIRVL